MPGTGGGLLLRLFGMAGDVVALVGDEPLPGRGDVGAARGGGARPATGDSGLSSDDDAASRSDSSSPDSEPALGDMTVAGGTGGGSGRAAPWVSCWAEERRKARDNSTHNPTEQAAGQVGRQAREARLRCRASRLEASHG